MVLQRCFIWSRNNTARRVLVGLPVFLSLIVGDRRYFWNVHRGNGSTQGGTVSVSDGRHAVSVLAVLTLSRAQRHASEIVKLQHGPERDGNRDLPKGSSSMKVLPVDLIGTHAIGALVADQICVDSTVLTYRAAGGLEPSLPEIATTLRRICDCNRCTRRRSPTSHHLSGCTAEIAAS